MAGGVVQLVQRLIPGGIETLALELAARLPGENRVVSMEWSRAQIIGNWPDVADAAAPFEGLEKAAGFKPAFVLALARRLRALAPRAVMAHHIGPLLYGGLACRLAGVPRFIYVEHDVWHYQSRNHRRLARIASALGRPHVVAVSNAVAATVRTIMPGRPVSVIRNAVETDRFVPADKAAARAALGLPAGRPVIGVAGRLEHVKGQDVLLDALPALPDALLVLVGQGSTREALAAQARRLGLHDRVIFLGQRKDMEAIYPAFDIACLPSRNEGLPLSILEAQACGVAVVASDVGSVSEGICPGSGAVVPREDPDALAAALRARLGHPPGAAPRLFVLEHFSWPRMITAYEGLLGRAPS